VNILTKYETVLPIIKTALLILIYIIWINIWVGGHFENGGHLGTFLLGPISQNIQ
jgi:hypothetical protein